MSSQDILDFLKAIVIQLNRIELNLDKLSEGTDKRILELERFVGL